MGVRIVLAATLAIWVALLPVAWHFGYPTSDAVLALGLALAAGWLAWAVAVRLSPTDGAAGTAVRAAVVAIAAIVLQTVVLDGLHLLTLAGFILAGVASAGLALALGRRGAVRPVTPWPPVGALTVVSLAAVSALVALALGFAVTHAPLTLYDAPSYHLYFAARWLQDHALSILSTPFSDVAQAYAPANGELVFLWLMAPWHGDLLARAGEFPFWLLAATAIYAIARRLGARPVHAWYPAAFFMVARPVVEQAVGADVDLILAALVAAAVYLGLVAADRDTRSDWAIWGVAVGLALGTKFLAVIYLPVILSVAVAHRVRWRAVWATPGILVFGAGWYIRNWIIAGSPIYPATLSVFGLTLARGAFSRQAMLNTVFHTRDLALAPAVLAHSFGVTLAIVAWPLALAGAIAAIRRGWWPSGWLAAVPFAMAVLFWLDLPVNIDARFFLPAVGLALVPMALLFGSRRRSNAVLHVLALAGLAWALVGWSYDPSPKVPWFMGDWFELNGIVSPNSLMIFGLMTVAFGAVWMTGRRSRWVVPAVALLVASAGAVLVFGEDTDCLPARCDRLHVSDPFIRAGLIRTWEWMDDHVHDATVAYTGINLPYPLSGSHLTNRVVYANIDGHIDWRFHDYDRAYRDGRFDPLPPALAVSSGELEPVPPRRGPRDDALRPRYERLEGFPDLWTLNLKELGVGYVFVGRLSAYEINYQAHGPEGFPIEDQWAQAAPDTFTMVHDDADARVYAVHLQGRTR